ncbi:diguanylate cyclase [Herbaspirillum huttiense]|uniref:sensor domain-containing diguanylate cyclase n=1 Tax=Herbaspirillum huttiense TaxID=863372 RepID=UPI003B3B014F
MITHISHRYSDLDALKQRLDAPDIRGAAARASSTLVQIYYGPTDTCLTTEIVGAVKAFLPEAVVVGASSVGEIADGRLLSREIILGLTFFQSSHLSVISQAWRPGEEAAIGEKIRARIAASPEPVRGVLLLTAQMRANAAGLVAALGSDSGETVFFGGGAGDYGNLESAFIFHETTVYIEGVIAVLLHGANLHIESHAQMGWNPLSTPMRITSAEPGVVRTIDDKPAFAVYKQMLGIENDENFFFDALAFPLLLERHGTLLARTPAKVRADGALFFAGDVEEGEHFRLGYADLNQITESVRDIHQRAMEFSPQVVFLYSCCGRRFLMQKDVEIESLPFQNSAPTFGFYTYAEYHGTTQVAIHNSTLIAVTMREGNKVVSRPTQQQAATNVLIAERDPFIVQQVRVTARLTKFIRNMTEELEKTRAELSRMAFTDQLTNLPNRVKLNAVLSDCVNMANRYGTPFSIILSDVDRFKSINDNYGHLAGDSVLKCVAEILTSNTRSTDVAGRWGGEEFLVITANTALANAVHLAEKVRMTLAQASLPNVRQITASFGVASYAVGETISALLDRADHALYAAKRFGRDRVQAIE